MTLDENILKEARALRERVLELQLGADYEKLRSEVGGEPAREPGRGRLPFAGDAQAVLESALHESLSQRHGWVGSEHILLALLGQGGRPVEILERLGVNADALRDEVNRLLREAA